MLCAATTPAYAFAQDAAAPADTGTAIDDSDYGNDIIVTASKRSQTLQDTPVAVSVTSAAQLEDAQIRDLIDLQTAVPSLRVSQLQSSANTNRTEERRVGNERVSTCTSRRTPHHQKHNPPPPTPSPPTQ